MKAKIQSLIVLWAMGLSSVVYAGAESSGGVDNYNVEDGSAWFLSVDSTKKIRTCVDRDKSFGVTQNELEASLQSAFQKWDEYLKTKHFKSPTLNFVTKLELLKKCDGTEDLKVYFGSSDAQVEVAKQKFSKPFAFSHRISYDAGKAWGKGIIWISSPSSISPGIPNWSDPLNLNAILLHEVGHVLGCSHAHYSIMSNEIVRGLKYEWPEEMRKAYFSRIDHQKELLRCEDCIGSYDGSTRDAFMRLLGRGPTGAQSAKFIIESREGKHLRIKGSLVISDDLGSFSFPVETRLLIASTVEENVELFKTEIEKAGQSAINRGGSSYYDELTLPDGTALPIIYNENMFRAVTIAVLEPTGQKVTHIFLADGQI